MATKHNSRSKAGRGSEPVSKNQLENVYPGWAMLRKWLKNLNNPSSPFHVLEVDLDHKFSYLTGISEEAFKQSDMIDFEKVSSTELADIERLQLSLDRLPASEEEKLSYKRIIENTRKLVEIIGAIPVPEEGRLGFRAAVKREFSFLENNYGFQMAETSPISVSYISRHMEVELSYCLESPEMTFTLRVRNDEKQSNEEFYYDDLLYAFSHNLPLDFARFDLRTRDGVESLIWEIAAFMREFGKEVLRDDETALKILREKAEERDRLRTEELNRLFGKQ